MIHGPQREANHYCYPHMSHGPNESPLIIIGLQRYAFYLNLQAFVSTFFIKKLFFLGHTS